MKILFFKNKNVKKNDNYEKNSLEKQKECCICFDKMNEEKFHCGHNMHILCIMKSNLKNKCALCFADITNECINHINSCNNKKCYCKETELYNNTKAHQIITEIINNDNININSIKNILLINNIKNIDEILKNYFE